MATLPYSAKPVGMMGRRKWRTVPKRSVRSMSERTPFGAIVVRPTPGRRLEKRTCATAALHVRHRRHSGTKRRNETLPWDRSCRPGQTVPNCRSQCVVAFGRYSKSGLSRLTNANETLRPIHDRMPVVLEHENVAPWLSGETGTELLVPAAEEKLTSWPLDQGAWVSAKGGCCDQIGACCQNIQAQSASLPA